jgi:hypothetical protein
VGIGIDGPHSGAAASSMGNISALLPSLASSRALTLEVWLRSSAQAEEQGAAPILALGGKRSADAGACSRGEFGLLLSQSGGYLELQLSAAVAFRGHHSCYHVEVSAGRRAHTRP